MTGDRRRRSPVKPAPFEYHAPGTLGEAVALLAELGEDAKVLAGGQSLIPMLALRLTAFGHLVDVGRISEMKGVERHDGSLAIGAGTTEADVGSNAAVGSAVPLLARATPLIGHFQIRNRGTLGGSIAHADPAAEYPAVALALDAVHGDGFPEGSSFHRGRRFLPGPLDHQHGTGRDPRERVLPGLDREDRIRHRGDCSPPR